MFPYQCSRSVRRWLIYTDIKASLQHQTCIRVPSLWNPQRRRAGDNIHGWYCGYRQYSKSSLETPVSTTAENRIATFLDGLEDTGTSFRIKGESISVITEPLEFYETLKMRVLKAQSRIVLATLYIGKEETELVDTIRQSLKARKNLRVTILIDALRGTREAPSDCSASLLSLLQKEFPSQVDIRLFHTPKLNGIFKQVLPNRFNEGIGLMHMKIYAFDDTLLLSGANLSRDYFRNRQDRYFLFQQCPGITQYFVELVQTISKISFRLIPKGEPTKFGRFSLQMPSSQVPNPFKLPRTFMRYAKDLLTNFQKDWIMRSRYDLNSPHENDTVVIPVLQMGIFGIREEEIVFKSLLSAVHQPSSSVEEHSVLNITSGYFSLYRGYQERIIKAIAIFKLLAASPEANGFYGSKGVSKYIPDAYTYLERRFFNKIIRNGRSKDIQIQEWRRPHWTYHAKGLWVTLPTDLHPRFTMIGSSNYGHRSVKRDLEAQALLFTNNEKLSQSLGRELENLHSWAYTVNEETFEAPDRQVKLGVKLATKLVKSML